LSSYAKWYTPSFLLQIFGLFYNKSNEKSRNHPYTYNAHLWILLSWNSIFLGVWSQKNYGRYTIYSITNSLSFRRSLHSIYFSGICVWAIVFAYAWLYTKRYDTPIIEEIRLILKYGVIWFFFYMSYIHLASWFVFKKEIPRLIIFYACIFSILFSMVIRLIRNIVYEILVEYNFVEKKMILIIEDELNPIEIQKVNSVDICI